jgi:uncharacterized membrane protein YvbJ
MVVIAIIIILLLVIAFTLKQAQQQPVRSEKDKKQAIINGYKSQLRNILLPLQNDPEALKLEKSRLLKAFSLELSRNIFFDENEMRNIIKELAHYEV